MESALLRFEEGKHGCNSWAKLSSMASNVAGRGTFLNILLISAPPLICGASFLTDNEMTLLVLTMCLLR